MTELNRAPSVTYKPQETPMSAKPKPRHKAPDTTTWSVLVDGTPQPVTAEALDIDTGNLVFTVDQVITKLVAAGHWTIVEIVPPPPEE